MSERLPILDDPASTPEERAEAIRKMAAAMVRMAEQGKLVIAALRDVAARFREVERP